jgi:hypothetical protein
VHLAQPANDRPDELAGGLAVLLEPLGKRERALQVPGYERIGEVVGAGCGVTRSQALDVRHGHIRRGVQCQPDLLELAGEPLLALADPADELLGGVLVQLQAELAGAFDTPLRELPRLRSRVLAGLATGLLDRLAELLDGLAARDQDEHGVGRQVGQRGFERAELAGLPAIDTIDEQVARRGVEAQRGE